MESNNLEYVKNLEQKNKELIVKLEKSEQKNKVLKKRLCEVLLDYRQFIDQIDHGLNRNKYENRKKTTEFIQRIQSLEETNSQLKVDLYNIKKRKREEKPRLNYSNKKAKIPLLISSSNDYKTFNLILTECLGKILDRQKILGEKHSELLNIPSPNVYDLVCKNNIGSENMKTITYALNNIVSGAMRLGGMYIIHNQIHGRAITTTNNNVVTTTTKESNISPLEKPDNPTTKLKKSYEPDSWMSFYI